METFALGCKFDTAHRQLRYNMALGASGLWTTTPTLQTGLITLAHYQAPILNQGPVGGCEGERAAMCLWQAFAAAGEELPWFPSQDGIYKAARCDERVPLADGSLPALVDDGCMTSSIYSALLATGIKKAGPVPVDGRNSDLDPSTVNLEPRLDELDEEALCVVTGEYAIDLTDPIVAVATMQAALASGYPTGVDFFCDTGFQRWGMQWSAGQPPVNSVRLTDPTGGGHAIGCDQINVTPAGVITLAGPNSWAEAWGSPAIDTSSCPNKGGQWRGDINWFKSAVRGVTIFKVQRIIR